MEKMEMRGLAGTIDQLVKNAEANPGQAQRRMLAHGLRVDVLLKDEQMHLQLSRLNVYPADREWSIVLREWPYTVSATPAKMEYNGRYYLRAHWKHVRERQGGLV